MNMFDKAVKHVIFEDNIINTNFLKKIKILKSKYLLENMDSKIYKKLTHFLMNG